MKGLSRDLFQNHFLHCQTNLEKEIRDCTIQDLIEGRKKNKRKAFKPPLPSCQHKDNFFSGERVRGASQVAQWLRNLPAKAGDAGDAGLITGSGRSPGGGNGNPLQSSSLGKPVDRGAWRAVVSPWHHKELNKTWQLSTHRVKMAFFLLFSLYFQLKFHLPNQQILFLTGSAS